MKSSCFPVPCDVPSILRRVLGDDAVAVFVYRLLQNNNITGRLPPELGALPRLQTLDLSNNRFSGRVPDTLGRLSALRYLCVTPRPPESSRPFRSRAMHASVAHVLCLAAGG